MSKPFFVPYDQIEPIYTPEGVPARYIWQAFPWTANFITSYGECTITRR